MKVVIDAHIPFLVEAVRANWPDVEIVPMKPEQIDALSVREADVVVVRTRTQVNEALLAGSRVRLVCTATIGYDHIDTAWCEANSIRWMSCPGCNAQAVCDYIEEAIEEFQISNFKFQKCNPMPTVGIVGVGHVGSKVAAMAARKGYRVLLNDPPKGIGVSLDEIAQDSDIITFHVPLVGTQNTDRFTDRIQTDLHTYHLCNADFLGRCKPGALIINAARGGVVDEEALLRSGHPFILDTWENEPHIRPASVRRAFRASMHIAGYSVEGKRNATQMCLDAIAGQFGLEPIDITSYPYDGETTPIKNSNEPWLAAVSEQLKAHPECFEALRKSYPLREERVR